MWIPRHSRPQLHQEHGRDIILAVTTSADALIAARGLEILLREVYLEITANHTLPLVKVCTDNVQGDGIRITPVQAYCLDKANLLGEEEKREVSGFGEYNLSRNFYHRRLDMHKFYEFLSDDTLPKPIDAEQMT